MNKSKFYKLRKHVGGGENTLKSNEKRYKHYNKTRIIYNHYKKVLVYNAKLYIFCCCCISKQGYTYIRIYKYILFLY